MKTLSYLTSIIAASALLVATGCSRFGCVSGSGHQISENRSINPFTFVETSGSMKVILKQGPQQVRIVADDNIQSMIRTSVHGNTLSIDTKGNFCNTGPITVYLSSPNFEGVDASGAVELMSEGKLNVKDFDLDLSGSSKVNLDLNAANVRTKSSGSSEIHLKGQAGSHDVDLSGSGSIDALDFVVGKYHIESTGASKSRINVLNTLEVRSSGSSDVEYKGNPSRVDNDDSGASSVKRIN